jgi:hypothetical protein
VTTFTNLFPRMPEGSIYVIEDLHTSYWPLFGGAVPAPDVSGVGLARALVDCVQANDPTFRWVVHRRRPRPSATVDAVQSVHIYPGLVVITKQRKTWRDLLRVTRYGPISQSDFEELRASQPHL